MAKTETNEAPAPRVQKITKTVDLDAKSVTFAFSNGNSFTRFLTPYEDDLGMITRLTLHGLSCKIGDAAAPKKDVDDAEEACYAVAERLDRGEWYKMRKGVELPPSAVIAACWAALEAEGHEVTEKVEAAIREQTSTAEGRKAVLANPMIAAEYQRIRASRAALKAAEAKVEAEKVEAPVSVGELFAV